MHIKWFCRLAGIDKMVCCMLSAIGACLFGIVKKILPKSDWRGTALQKCSYRTVKQ
ncbi:hypothetical protein O3689_07495 [Prevotella nigrescens]|uniref:hypothetical protein n=1 Tax=Prevotella nigrescens TaxID=28133 RepID=UPI00352CFA62